MQLNHNRENKRIYNTFIRYLEKILKSENISVFRFFIECSLKLKNDFNTARCFLLPFFLSAVPIIERKGDIARITPHPVA